jgi:hypothetical protein
MAERGKKIILLPICRSQLRFGLPKGSGLESCRHQACSCTAGADHGLRGYVVASRRIPYGDPDFAANELT